MTEALIDPLSSEIVYCQNWLRQNKVVIDPSGELTCPQGRSTEHLKEAYYSDYLRNYRNATAEAGGRRGANLSKFSKSDLIHELEKTCSDRSHSVLVQLKADMTFTAENDLVAEFLKALTGKDDPVNVSVMKHWLWMVKNRMHERLVDNHIMPIFYGLTGAGKSRAVAALTAPLADFRLDMKLTDFADKNVVFMFAKNLVVVADEMEGAEKTNIDTLKRIITADKASARGIYTDKAKTKKQKSSFIGTSNRPVDQMIFDMTGMRRFWQIDVLEVADWLAINALDYRALWQGINEDKAGGYIFENAEHREVIKARQQAMTTEDPVLLFLSENGIDPKVDLTYGGRPLPASCLYGHYRKWCDENGVSRSCSMVGFGKKLSGYGMKSYQKKFVGKNLQAYSVPEDCPIQSVLDIDQDNVLNFKPKGN